MIPFFAYINSNDVALQFTYSDPEQEINFLDIILFGDIHKQRVHYRNYRKPISETGLNQTKKLVKTLSVADIKEEKEPKGIFSKILKANKGLENTLPIQHGDILVKNGRTASICANCLWPRSADGTIVIPYNLSSAYNDSQRKLIQESIDEYETLTCVKFVPQTDETNFIQFESGSGCYSAVGRTGGKQTVGVDASSCMYKGIIQHQINHVLGFVHEHMRSDRDRYVTIMYQYISPGDTPNFNKANTNNLGMQYDYTSVMHYDRDAFSNTTGQATIVPIPDPNVPIGQRGGLSDLDVSKINVLYICSVCSTVIMDTDGFITSGNYPSLYSMNLDCVWLFRMPSNQVSLTFLGFDLQTSPNCTLDYVKIYDGPTKRHPVLIDRTCGFLVFPPIISSSNQLLVEFVSQSRVTRTGFKASYTTVKCGGTFYTPGRNISSPNYPNNYLSHLSCNYTIVAPVGRRLEETSIRSKAIFWDNS
ncbi:embryonic protein UVS.2-like [Anomaloglossus baeobatrachus]|uniref:embryonic protein UVS.2-like n=1 Tax=Anomaloglossus baeobatrachus TaxID=238106 RepID=UPI003F500D00